MLSEKTVKMKKRVGVGSKLISRKNMLPKKLKRGQTKC
jgi:hypothetical protein